MGRALLRTCSQTSCASRVRRNVHEHVLVSRSAPREGKRWAFESWNGEHAALVRSSERISRLLPSALGAAA